MWRVGLFLYYLLEFPKTLLNFHLQPFVSLLISTLSTLCTLFITLLQLPILILQLPNFILLYAHNDILLLQILLQEDVVHLVPLLDHHQVVIRVGELADVVLELDQLFLHDFLVLREILLSFLALLLLTLILSQHFFMLLVLFELEVRLGRNEVEHPLIISNFLQLLDQIFSTHFGTTSVFNHILPHWHLFELLVPNVKLEPQSLNIFLQLLLLTCHLVAFVFQRVDLLLLHKMQVFLHLELPLQFCKIVILVFVHRRDCFVGLEIWDGFLLEIDQDVVSDELYVLIFRYDIFLSFVQKSQ